MFFGIRVVALSPDPRLDNSRMLGGINPTSIKHFERQMFPLLDRSRPWQVCVLTCAWQNCEISIICMRFYVLGSSTSVIERKSASGRRSRWLAATLPREAALGSALHSRHRLSHPKTNQRGRNTADNTPFSKP